MLVLNVTSFQFNCSLMFTINLVVQRSDSCWESVAIFLSSDRIREIALVKVLKRRSMPTICSENLPKRLVYLALTRVKVLLLILSNKSIQYFCFYDLTGLKKLPYLKMVCDLPEGRESKWEQLMVSWKFHENSTKFRTQIEWIIFWCGKSGENDLNK